MALCVCLRVCVYGVLAEQSVQGLAESQSVSDSSTQLGVQKWEWALVAGEILGHFQNLKNAQST